MVAYELDSTTLCPACALRASKLAFMVTRKMPIPTSMDEVIADLILLAIENGQTPDPPVAVIQTEMTHCPQCGKELA